MTPEFIQQRIKEQDDYIIEVNRMEINPERKEEILKSATGQLRYFLNKWRHIQLSEDKVIVSTHHIDYEDELKPPSILH